MRRARLELEGRDAIAGSWTPDVKIGLRPGARSICRTAVSVKVLA